MNIIYRKKIRVIFLLLFSASCESTTLNIRDSAAKISEEDTGTEISSVVEENLDEHSDEIAKITLGDVPYILNVAYINTEENFLLNSIIKIVVEFNVNIDVTGVPQIELETGEIDRFAIYGSGSGSSKITFHYLVGIGDVSRRLDYKSVDSLVLNGGFLKDTVGTNASLVLPKIGSLPSGKLIEIGLVDFLWDFSDSTAYFFSEAFVEVTSNSASLKAVDSKISGLKFDEGTHVGTVLDENFNLTLQAKSSISSEKTPLFDKLLAYWNLDGNGNDSIGSYNADTIVGSPFQKYSQFGSGSLSIPDNGTYLETSSSPNINDEFTVSLWVRPSTDPAGEVLEYPLNFLNSANERAIAVSAGGPANNNSIALVICKTDGDNCNSNSSSFSTESNSFSSDKKDQWSHLVFTKWS